ncbi:MULTISPECIES: thioredoxin family protein [unclassified Gemella]|uniref:thioredoxin family protein n=1 Tax=unclassified Gemella TaxID=2624949 RepID=UPI001C057709|nr:MULTISPECIES: thioredoxin family protein [unclassified Gemella]MBU0278807.1 thioredoxin family protein [Gemella sp. zg-1178]QWQ39357.1 thioredoxin family protein [Gemella sp. zg-570]
MSFNEYIKDFQVINSSYLEKLIEEKEKLIVFLGRSTCPFCQIFAPKISKVSKDLAKQTFFVNTEDFTDENLAIFREKHNIKTVPALFVSKKGNTKVVCDSSLSEKAIISFIEE